MSLLSVPRRSLRGLVVAASLTAAAAAATPALAHGPGEHEAKGEKVTTNFEHAIPNIPGKTLVAEVVDYAPGGASAPHKHANSGFVYAYVVSGAVESKVNDGPTRVYRAGESWYEPPASRHPVSRNASKTEPARLLAVIVVDTDERGQVTTPDQGAH